MCIKFVPNILKSIYPPCTWNSSSSQCGTPGPAHDPWPSSWPLAQHRFSWATGSDAGQSDGGDTEEEEGGGGVTKGRRKQGAGGLWPGRQAPHRAGRTWVSISDCVQTLAQPLTSYMTSARLHDLSELQFFIYEIGKSRPQSICVGKKRVLH